MNPALIMLVVVALIFIGFSRFASHAEKSKKAERDKARTSFSAAASMGNQRPFVVPSKPTMAEEGTKNNLYGG